MLGGFLVRISSGSRFLILASILRNSDATFGFFAAIFKPKASSYEDKSARIVAWFNSDAEDIVNGKRAEG